MAQIKNPPLFKKDGLDWIAGYFWG